MDPATLTLFVNLGVAGVGLLLFVQGKLVAKNVADERLVEVRELYEARIKAADDRTADAERRADEWRALALGTERRLDAALPAVATAIGAPVPSRPPEAG